MKIELTRDIHPIDIIEQVAQSNDWTFERNDDNQILINILGTWSEYHASFSWMEERETLHLGCFFELKTPKNRISEMTQLLSLINEKLILGHFDLWKQKNAILFRESLLLSGGVEPTTCQVEALLSTALDACENHFQAFQSIIASSTLAKDAMINLMFETRGCA